MKKLEKSRRFNNDFYDHVAARARAAARETTGVLNDLLGRDAVATAPSML